MKSREKDQFIFIRLYSNEEIFDKIIEACKLHNVKSAVVVSGIGQLKKFKLGYFRNKGNYQQVKFVKPHELISLTGNICRNNDDYDIHIHATLGDENMKLIGGHLFSGLVEVTNEIVLLKTNIGIERRMEESTGLRGLFLG